MKTSILKPKTYEEILDEAIKMLPVDAFIVKFLYRYQIQPIIDLDYIRSIETPNIKVSVTEKRPYIEQGGFRLNYTHPFAIEIEINVSDYPSWEGQYQDKSIIIENFRVIEIRDNT